MASPRFAFGRILVLVASAAGIIAAVVLLALSWPAPAELFMARLLDLATLITCLLILGIALLIAWRAGDHAPNIAIAQSLAFIYGSIVVALLFDRLQVMPLLRQIVQVLLLFLASALYIRSAQLFPRKLTAADIASSPTVWGKSPPLQKAAAFLLHPAAAWIISATATAVILLTADVRVFLPMWMAITATGIVYFYITLRGPDVEARHKVLWLFEAALAAAITTIAAGALDLTLGHALTPDVRALIQLVFNIVNGLTMVICFAAAVFYAGAISPAFPEAVRAERQSRRRAGSGRERLATAVRQPDNHLPEIPACQHSDERGRRVLQSLDHVLSQLYLALRGPFSHLTAK